MFSCGQCWWCAGVLLGRKWGSEQHCGHSARIWVTVYWYGTAAIFVLINPLSFNGQLNTFFRPRSERQPTISVLASSCPRPARSLVPKKSVCRTKSPTSELLLAVLIAMAWQTLLRKSPLSESSCRSAGNTAVKCMRACEAVVQTTFSPNIRETSALAEERQPTNHTYEREFREEGWEQGDSKSVHDPKHHVFHCQITWPYKR